MKQNKLSFESENLVVDYISFKFQKLDNFTLKEIASYLFQIGFNSYFVSGRLAKPMKESILVDSKNSYEVLFVIENSYWKGTKLDFSGLNGKFFYTLVQQKLVSWELFSSATLGRFDINFSRKNREFDKTSVEDFFEDCHKKVRRTNKNVKFEKKSSGVSLKIQNRKSDHFYRIYQLKGANSIKFEYEMRGKFIRNYQRLLVSNCLEEFETSLSYSFFSRFGKLLPLSHSQLDWLVLKLRPFRKQKFSSTALKSHYIRKIDYQTSLDRKKFFTLLQFLVYVQTLDYEVDSLKSTRYRLVRFRVQDFLRYTGETYNYYQLKKLLDFFDELQINSLIKFFSDTQYRSLVTIPEVKLEKGRQNTWIANVWIAEELFYYAHPFLLPDLLKRKLTKHQFEVQFKVIQVFSSVDIEKHFSIEEFFHQYPSVLSNQDKNKMKEYFIQLIQLFEEHQLIESTYKVVSTKTLYQTNKLTSQNISKGFIVYERLSI